MLESLISGRRPPATPPVLTARVQAALWLACILALVPVLWGIRLIHDEVGVYAGGLYEQRIREALASGDFAGAERVAAGVMRVWLGSQDVEAAARLLRARARAGRGDCKGSLEDLQISAAFWRAHPWHVTEGVRGDLSAVSVSLAAEYLSRADIASGLAALSAGGRGSIAMGDFLVETASALPSDVRSRIWPLEPALIVEDFERDDSLSLEPRGLRELVEWTGFDSQVRFEGLRSASAKVCPRPGEPARVGVRLHLKLSQHPIGLRFRARRGGSDPLRACLVYWSDGAFQAHPVFFDPVEMTHDGWCIFDIPEVPHAGALPDALVQALPQDDVEVLDLDIEIAGAKDTCWLDLIEIYLPTRPSG